jgi:hypothetical protein
VRSANDWTLVVPTGELTSREAVERALDEFDKLGREAFLERYGYGYAKTWFVIRQLGSISL